MPMVMAAMHEIPCPDGYLLNANSPLADAHHTLNDYLVGVEEQGWKQATKRVNSLRDKRLKFRIWMALLDRLEWLHAAHAETYFKQLHDLTYAIEEWKLDPTTEDLICAIRKTAALAGVVMPYTPMPHLLAFVEQHGLTFELSLAIREFDAKIRHGSYAINQTRRQLLNSRLDMLAWWDEWNEIDLKRCWSEVIRSDYRSMQSPDRENWRQLLHSIQGDEGVQPSRSWMAKAQQRIAAIGVAPFRGHMLRWFHSLQPSHTVRLSREGSFLLRSLLWLVPHLQSAELLGIVRGIPRVTFKPAKNGEKVIRAAAEIAGIDYISEKSSPLAPSLDELTARALKAVLSPGACSALPPGIGGRVSFEAEIAYIRGDLDKYRMHISTGAVFRESDGQRVHVNLTDPIPGPLARIDMGGIAELLGQMIVLAQDAKNAGALSFTPDE
jgi:hypothetical protein